jgi:cell wall-associated NlpC family hydrolase
MWRVTPCLILLTALAIPALSSAQDSEKVLLGKLGQAAAKTNIYRTASTKSSVYYRLKEFEYIVIKPYEKDERWVRVLLQNGRDGFVLSEKIAKLPYNVTADAKGSPETASRGDIKSAIDYSYNYVGTPYKWGGNDITKGIDCSAFVKDVFKQIGVALPRTAAEQYKVGKSIETIKELKPGDRLYFWDKKRGLIGHTGIFTGFQKDGGAYFIHSSSSNNGVATDDLRNPKWKNLLVAARR